MDEEEDQKVEHPTFQALVAALKHKPGAAGRERAWLAEQDEQFNVQATQNWKFRGLPRDFSKLQRLSAISGAPIEALSRGNSADIRGLSTPGNVGMPGKGGDTTTVKLTLVGVKADPIKELPLLSWGMIDRIGMPNKEVQGMTRIDLGFAANACWDPDLDKVIQVPDTSLGPRFEMGDYLIMHPLTEGESIEAGRLPVLVRLPDGGYALAPHNPLQAAINNLKVVAVCRQFFSPPPP